MSTTITPYLNFAGNAREVLTFYEQALGATIETMIRYDDMPAGPEGGDAPDTACMGGPPPDVDAIMHSCLRLPGGAMLFASDLPPAMPHNGIHGVMLALQYETDAEAEAAFAALSDGGTVQMPLAPTFWASVFGAVVDRFGVSWGINGKAIDFQQT